MPLHEIVTNYSPLVTAGGTIIAAIIAGVYVTMNVNRTQKANMKTENEKFKRDLNCYY